MFKIITDLIINFKIFKNLFAISVFILRSDKKLAFPSGLGYDKSNDRVRTPKVNAIFGSIPILLKENSNIKKGEPIPVHQFSDCVTSTGLFYDP
jgi:hypothetical protein